MLSASSLPTANSSGGKMNELIEMCMLLLLNPVLF